MVGKTGIKGTVINYAVSSQGIIRNSCRVVEMNASFLNILALFFKFFMEIKLLYLKGCLAGDG